MKDQYPIAALFKKYLEVQCTPGEIQELFKLINQKGNEDLFRQLIANELGFVPSAQKNIEPEDKAVTKVKSLLLNEIRAQLNTKQHHRNKLKTFITSEWLRIAALWLVIGSASLFLFYRHFTDRYNAQIKNSTKQLVTQNGQRKLIRLFDGTKIWLSPSSTIKYKDQLVNSYREVTLDGEAFFEVAKDKKHPFIIHTGQVQTEVVGTSFNIRAFEKQHKVTVTVVTGIVKVSVWSATNAKIKQVTLKPNQSADFTKGIGTLKTDSVANIKPETKRKDGILTYNGTPVQDVIADFSRYYNLSIELENKSAQCLCYGEFDTTKPIRIVLDQLAAAINAKVVYKNERYILQGGCEER